MSPSLHRRAVHRSTGEPGVPESEPAARSWMNSELITAENSKAKASKRRDHLIDQLNLKKRPKEGVFNYGLFYNLLYMGPEPVHALHIFVKAIHYLYLHRTTSPRDRPRRAR